MPAIDLPVKQRLVLAGWSGIRTEKVMVMTFVGGKKGAAVMNGQYSLFDYCNDPKDLKPCEYSFKRYIGQKVYGDFTASRKEGIIVKIEQYYTIIDVGGGRLMAGSPHNIWPIEGGEHDG
jgi:hypothetical protein